MELFGSQLVGHGATCRVKMIFLSPEVFSGAELNNTGEVLRENSSEVNNTLPVVTAVGKKRFETLSKATGLSWRKRRAGWLEEKLHNHPSSFLICDLFFLPVPSFMASSSLLLGEALQTPESACLQQSLLDFICKQRKDMMNFALILLLCLMSMPSWVRVSAANVSATHSCISSVLQSHRNREAGRAHCMQPSRSLYSGGSGT